MLKEELNSAKTRVSELEEELKILLLPKDPNDEKNVIVEIRAGAGGDEAALFAAEFQKKFPDYMDKNEPLRHKQRVSESQINDESPKRMMQVADLLRANCISWSPQVKSLRRRFHR